MAGAGGRLMGLLSLDQVKLEGCIRVLKILESSSLLLFPFFPSTEYETRCDNARMINFRGDNPSFST